jgi:hypothetical protein
MSPHRLLGEQVDLLLTRPAQISAPELQSRRHGLLGLPIGLVGPRAQAVRTET